MDLYLFPTFPSPTNGYGMGVEYAYNRLAPRPEDMVVWYVSASAKHPSCVKSDDVIIEKTGNLSRRSVFNILSGRPRLEVGVGDLKDLKGRSFKKIHCDETTFFRALRNIFPNSHISVRFHNNFSRIYARMRQLRLKLDWKYTYTLKSMFEMERCIFEDKNSHKIFISDEDRYYYTSMYGVASDSETWPYYPNADLMRKNRKRELVLDKKLVWFGGVESHKYSSVKWFIDEVYPQLLRKIPELEFHLWGSKTSDFNAPKRNIFGHGYYDGDDMPLKNALYINPDIIGGGIKMKLLTLFENGIPFISSPFGFEGYSKELIDGKFCNVVEDRYWVDYILSLFGKKA